MEIQTDHPINNLLGWWELAGVDALVSDDAASWLVRNETVQTLPLAGEIVNTMASRRDEMPASLSEFHDWLRNSPDVPEARWASSRILPHTTAKCDIMVVSDMPESDDMQAGMLFSGGVGRLLDAMLRAIGLGRDSIYLCSLASARPPGGMFDPDSAGQLARIMRRHISLVDPKRILLFGDKTSRALLTADAGGARGQLQILNHDGGTVSAIATFHPRFLLRQPGAKAECWKDLQLFAKGLPS